MAQRKRVVILGGGFGGVFTALELEKLFRGSEEIDITLVNQENFLLFTPMLHEIAASDLDPTDIVNPIHKLLRKTQFFCGSVDKIDLATKTVTVSHGLRDHSHELAYDHLVLALGSITHFYDLPGLAENALTMKSLGDAIHLRNRMIALLEEADFECCKSIRRKLLTFVVAGGGFAGVETVAAINDFLHEVLPFYRNLNADNLRIVLVHSGNVILPELDEKLGKYATGLLEKRGVEVRLGTRVASYDGAVIRLSDESELESGTLIWTAGTAPHPLLESLECQKERGRIFVSETLQLWEHPGIWALGDCASIPNGLSSDGKPRFHPPTAQHAIREAKIVAQNIRASIQGKSLSKFQFRTLGQLASLGHRKGVAQVFRFRFSGFIAWWLWRSIYLMKLPRIEKRVRVALSWTLDLLFSKDNVQLPTGRSSGGAIVEVDQPKVAALN